MLGPVRTPSGPYAPPQSAGSRSGHGHPIGSTGSTDGGATDTAGTDGLTTTGWPTGIGWPIGTP